MNEEFLYYIWSYGLYESGSLKTRIGQALEILRTGIRNSDSGPDFADARLKIDGTLWAGNIEIHVVSSDWNKHGHQHDVAYNNVILHVVYEDDVPVFNSSGAVVPTLELKTLIPKQHLSRYYELMEQGQWLRCANVLHEVSPVRIAAWLDRLIVQRMEEKTLLIKRLLEQSRNNWKECLYQAIAVSYGFKVNATPFEMLSNLLPYHTVRKYSGNTFMTESLLYGMSGLLNGFFEDEYPRNLQNEFRYLQGKHQLVPMESSVWKFMRLRPRNFPTLRLSQFAGILAANDELLDKVLNEPDLEKQTGVFNSSASPYWRDHYLFDKIAGRIQPSMGWDSACLIVINAIVPFLFLYGKEKGEQRYIDRAISFLEQLKPEMNNAMREWKNYGIKAGNALQSQALLHLRNRFCSQSRCLECSIGVGILAGKKTN